MQVRGAPLIGVTAAYGVALAMRGDPTDAGLAAAAAWRTRFALPPTWPVLLALAPGEPAPPWSSASPSPADPADFRFLPLVP